jgi:hypothetical protein
MHSGVIDTAVQPTLSKVFMNDPKHNCFSEGIWFGCTRHSGVIGTTVTCTAQSLTPVSCTAESLPPLWHALRRHWHRCANMTQIWGFHSRFSPRIRSHIQKLFNPCIRGLWGVVWWKNQRSKISCQGPLKVEYGTGFFRRPCRGQDPRTISQAFEANTKGPVVSEKCIIKIFPYWVMRPGTTQMCESCCYR